ncbi:hypothetical protein ACFSHT_09060 [Paraburkholderia silviterrae]|uniref:MFS transporter n=1 Tax=Paraburkholderia silviterrae TaxID=2528715 RepID=A0A4R5MDG8_9BURK|nr:hypothetical protein [Paraburkholderia silviterrae]TDG25140.1 hypothetical protein EYW47_04570 [Paraburkholderia silviterrae]
MTPKVRDTLAAACVWCAVTGGAAALAAGVMLGAMRVGATATALAGSAVALLAMALLPAALARRFVSRATVPVAASLVLAMAAMTAAAAHARAGSVPDAMPAVLALAGLALLTAAWPHLSARHTQSSEPPPQIDRTPIQRAQQGFIVALPGSAALLAPALLAGLSSGVLARFQFFALCGAGPFSYAQMAVSLCAAVGFGLLAERIDHRYALLALFALRGALLAALTLDALAPWAALAAPAFAVLDALTLPTLLRIGRAAQAGCPGVAHHMGMLAGAALATTSWGFGQGFHALFLAVAALNLMRACALAARRCMRTATQHQPHSTQHYASRFTSRHTPHFTDRPASPALASGGAIEIR